MSSRDKCITCAKTVYITERLVAEDKIFHKNCFKCAHCKNTIRLGNYASLDGKYYCKPHFKQLFALKGNYNEGFGTTKHSAKWNSTTDVTTTHTPTTPANPPPEVPISASPATLEREKEKEKEIALELAKEPEEPVPSYFGLTPEEIKDAEVQFIKYDEDKSGTIDREELYKLLVDVNKGKQSAEILHSTADMHFKAADKDVNGQIDELEFLQVYAKLLKNPQ